MRSGINEEGKMIEELDSRLDHDESDYMSQIHNKMRLAALEGKVLSFKMNTLIGSAMIYGILGGILGVSENPYLANIFISWIVGCVFGMAVTAFYNYKWATSYDGIEYAWSLLLPLGVAVSCYIAMNLLVWLIGIFLMLVMIIIVAKIFKFIGGG